MKKKKSRRNKKRRRAPWPLKGSILATATVGCQRDGPSSRQVWCKPSRSKPSHCWLCKSIPICSSCWHKRRHPESRPQPLTLLCCKAYQKSRIRRQWLRLWNWQSLRCACASQTYSSLSQPGQSPPAAARETSVPSDDWKPFSAAQCHRPAFVDWLSSMCMDTEQNRTRRRFWNVFSTDMHAQSLFKLMTLSLTPTN